MVSRGRPGSTTVPSSQYSPALVCTFTEITFEKLRPRELRDSMISMPRPAATSRALIIVTAEERSGRRSPATAALVTISLRALTSGPYRRTPSACVRPSASWTASAAMRSATSR
jgi:hypothetical protein